MSPARWSISPLDSDVHLLLDRDDPRGEITAHCGQPLPTDTLVYHQPPPGPPCEDCRVLYLAAFTTTDVVLPHCDVTPGRDRSIRRP